MSNIYASLHSRRLTHMRRYPVLLAIDDFQALFCMSQYRDPLFKSIKAYHLTFPRTLLEFASGKKSFVCLRGFSIAGLD